MDTHDYKKTALIIRLIIATGIRTSELPSITIEAVQQGHVKLDFNNSTRRVTLPAILCVQLLQFANDSGIFSGSIFLTKTGLPCGRNAMYRAFRKLATAAGIEPARLTSESLRKYYNDKHSEVENITTVQSYLGYKSVNYFVEYNQQDDKTLSKNLDEILA